MKSIADLPLNERLDGKWIRILGLIDRPGRKVVQSYNDGHIKIVREKSVPMMTRHLIDGAKNVDRPPTWREIVNRKEAQDLWKAEVYFMYHRHHRVWGAHFYNLNNYIVQKNGGQNNDLDMIEDPKAKQRALSANEAVKTRDRVRDESRQHRDKQQEINEFFLELARKYREERDVKHMRMKEEEMFKQEQMRERARRQAIESMGGEKPKRQRKKVEK